jgi:O-antigen/teichoic acid export membrane protein
MWARLIQRAPAGYFDLAKVMGGNVSRNLLRGVLKVLIAGFLAPPALGVLRSIFSFFKIVTSFVDLGLDYAMVIFLSSAIQRREQEEQDRILNTVLGLKLVVTAVILIVGNALAPQITVWVLSDPSLTVYTRLVFLAVGGQMLWKYISSYLSARQAFGRLALYLSTMPLLMLVLFVLLVLVHAFSLPLAILLYLFAPLATVLIWWPTLGLKYGRFWNPALAGKIVGFSRWVYLSNSTSATRNNLNPILLKNARLSGSLEVGEIQAGLYGFGNDLANEVTLLSQSLLTVLLPKASGKSSPRKLRRFVLRSYRHLIPLLIPFALLALAARPFLLGLAYFKASYLEYLPSLNVFTVLYAAALFSVAVIPMQAALYAMRLPQVETYIEFATIFFLIAGSVLIIPRFGADGAALLILIQRMITFVALMLFGFRRLRRLETEAR